MDLLIKCPVCNKNKWQVLGQKTHKIDDAHWQYGYPKIQKHVFFEIWNKNSKEVLRKRCLCKNCGFVTDVPRPDEQDILMKYEYLSKVEKYLGATKGISKRAMQKEYLQSSKIINFIYTFKNNKKAPLEILDHGGGDGHFLFPMKNEGHNCYIVDYNKYPISGVKHLSEDLSKVSKNYKFDLIISRHVLEHVASPSKIVESFKPYLNNNGIVYAEVPVQLEGQKFPLNDPVTHINFFQKHSLSIMFERLGYEVLYKDQKNSYYHGKTIKVAYLFARKSTNIAATESSDYSYKYSLKMLNRPVLFEKFKRTTRNPIKIKSKIMKYYNKLMFHN